MPARSFLSFVIVFAGLAVMATVLAGHGAQRGKSVPFRAATPVLIDSFGVLDSFRPANVAPTPGPPPRPVPPPSEPALLRVADGEIVELAPPGERIVFPVFSEDSTWLYYGHERDLNQSVIARVDLRSADKGPEDIAPGFKPVLSSRGMVAFGRRDDDMIHRIFVVDSARTLREMPVPGTIHSAIWSPDGRWLAYSEGYKGDGVLMDQVLVDTDTWTHRTFAQTLPCQCDGGPRAAWAPNSSFFMFRPAGQSEPLVYRPEGGEPEPGPTPRILVWLDADTYMSVQEYQRDGGYVRDVVTVDANSGDVTTLAEGTGASIGPNNISPDGRLVAVTEDRNWGGTTIQTMDGQELHTGLRGVFQSWSADGRYFLTTSRDESCQNGFALFRAADGSDLGCYTGHTFHGADGGFSPTDPLLAYYTNEPQDENFPLAMPPLNHDLYVLDLDSGVQRQLASDLAGYLGCLMWSPDGQWLMFSAGYDVNCSNF